MIKENILLDANANTSLLQQFPNQKQRNKSVYNKQLKNINNDHVIKPHVKWDIELDEVN